ncbi:F-box domain-containing protein [Favolaschia claudopus]|uniref:F-box domain-containing protein n=1 Tax=Favolaschia claudopus TaxID=2862362 RepID=A0AAW0AK37_9AGAR
MGSDQSSQYPRLEAANNVYHALVPNDFIQSSANCDQRDSQGCRRPSGAPAHPIHALPPELISLIFVHCLPTGAAGPRKLHPSTAPLLLTRICSAWRTLALRTPELWACVAFEVFHTTPSSPNSGFQSKPFELKLPKLVWWLARGADHPLTLHLHCRQHSAGLVPLLVAHTQRWADVDLFLHPTTLAGFDMHTVEMTDFELPLLRRLSLGCSPRSWPIGAGTDAALPRVTAFANAPHLTHVSLLKLPPSAVKLPWTQLTHFYGSCAAVEDVAWVLGLAPELQRLQLDFQQWSPSSSTIPPLAMATEDVTKSEGDANIIHTSLKSFTLHTHPSSPIPLSVLLGSGSKLTLPSLTSLNLPPVTPGDVGALVAFVSRSCLSHTLQQLTFALAPLSQDAILEILSPLKSLQKLELHFPTQIVLGDILRALVVTPPLMDDTGSRTTDDGNAGGRAPFLPSLHELRIDCYRGKVTYAQLRKALEARWNVGCDVAVAEAQHGGNSLHPPSASKGRSLHSHQSVARLRTFTMTTLTPNPKSASSSPSVATVPLPARQTCPRPDSDPDESHLAALRVLQAQGMSLSVASVYGGNVV